MANEQIPLWRYTRSQPIVGSNFFVPLSVWLSGNVLTTLFCKRGLIRNSCLLALTCLTRVIQTKRKSSSAQTLSVFTVRVLVALWNANFYREWRNFPVSSSFKLNPRRCSLQLFINVYSCITSENCIDVLCGDVQRFHKTCHYPN